MISFSEKNGLKKIKAIQYREIDYDLKRDLWNLVYRKFKEHKYTTIIPNKWDENFNLLIDKIYSDFIKVEIDAIPEICEQNIQRIKIFFFQCEWYEIYDFIEIIYENIDNNIERDTFNNECNEILRKENSAYRLVKGIVTQVTCSEEISAIEDAIQKSDNEVSTHLQKSLKLLSNKTEPDYENSIKESISAVESLVRILLNKPGKTLSDLLKNYTMKIHPSFQAGLEKIYAYTSDEGGVRHAFRKDNDREVDSVDAVFMLVICSAFVNYISQKHGHERSN